MTRRIRIARMANGELHFGPWWPAEDWRTLSAWVKNCNARYGLGTHVIEFEETYGEADK